jgi:hypothetical protein
LHNVAIGQAVQRFSGFGVIINYLFFSENAKMLECFLRKNQAFAQKIT